MRGTGKILICAVIGAVSLAAATGSSGMPVRDQTRLTNAEKLLDAASDQQTEKSQEIPAEQTTTSVRPAPEKTPVPVPTRTAGPRAAPPSPPLAPSPPLPKSTPIPAPTEGAERDDDTRPIIMREAALPLFVQDEIVLALRETSLGNAEIAARFGVSVIRSASLEGLGVKMVTARLPDGQSVEAKVAALNGSKALEWAQPNYIYQLLEDTRQSGLALHGLDRDSTLLPTGLPPVAQSAKIALIDSPVDRNHPALDGASIRQIGELKGSPASPHGTAIAELLVGEGEFHGVAQGAALISIPAFTPIDAEDWHSPSTSTSDFLMAALELARRMTPDVLNLSFGSPANHDEGVARQLAAMHGDGICIAAAAGNGGADSPVRFPARMRETIAVAAVNSLETAYEHGSRGPEIDIAAWGVDILAAVPGGRRIVSGTSFAAPMVAGAMLRMPACGPAKRAHAVRAALSFDAKDLGDAGRDAVFGAGLFRFGRGARDSAAISEAAIAEIDATNPEPTDTLTPIIRVAILAGGTLFAGFLFLLFWRRRKPKDQPA